MGRIVLMKIEQLPKIRKKEIVDVNVRRDKYPNN